MTHDFQADIDAIAGIDAVPTILDVVCRSTGMGFAAVARVTGERWIACRVLDHINFGLQPGGELKVETTICHEIRESREPVVINHVAEDEAYCGHPTPPMYGFQSYISMPIIRRNGEFFGTLCAIDPAPARLKNPEIIGMFRLFAELIAAHLDANEELSRTKTALRDERKLSELRDQFIAVLGHDLRNPVASINSGANLLLRSDLDAKSRNIVILIQGSVVRMRGLIENVMDFARARLGGGVSLELSADMPLAPALEHVVSELRTVDPDRDIDVDFALSEPVRGDAGRIAQLFSNLLGNALAHGAKGTPIRVSAATPSGQFELSVSNSGPSIPAAVLKDLFQPFFRGKASHQGLGLGLYIASEIARAHGGRIDATSNESETRFTFRMPLTPV
jgi:signal transduction histidine kinase